MHRWIVLFGLKRVADQSYGWAELVAHIFDNYHHKCAWIVERQTVQACRQAGAKGLVLLG